MLAVSLNVNNSKTVLKVIKIDSSGFTASKITDNQNFTFNGGTNLVFNELLNKSEHSNKSFIDLQIDYDSLWCLSYESKHYNRPGQTLFNEQTLTFKSTIEKYTIKQSMLPSSNAER